MPLNELLSPFAFVPFLVRQGRVIKWGDVVGVEISR